MKQLKNETFNILKHEYTSSQFNLLISTSVKSKCRRVANRWKITRHAHPPHHFPLFLPLYEGDVNGPRRLQVIGIVCHALRQRAVGNRLGETTPLECSFTFIVSPPPILHLLEHVLVYHVSRGPSSCLAASCVRARSARRTRVKRRQRGKKSR